jgi:hypothetical protein
MAKIEFHPEAARAIDARGGALLSKVRNVTSKSRMSSFASESIPHMKITEAQIVGRITGESVDEFKKEVTAVHFEGLDGAVGLDREATQELDKLVQLAHKSLSTKATLSAKFMRGRLIDWLQQTFRKETVENLSSFLVSSLVEAVASRTILIPIAYLRLEVDLPFGPVEFKVMSRELMDSWHEWYRSRCPPSEMEAFEVWFDRLRKDNQGLAAVSLTVEADEDYALEQCLEKAEQAVAFLRVLHPVNTSPHTALYVRPLGSENIESYSAYCYKAGALQGRRKHVRWPFPSFWEIPKGESNQKITQGLIFLFSAKERTDFQQRLFDALLIYSRNNIAREAYEKLIFCLVAVESMLLKNASEPIQDNIGERMAYLLGKTPEERLDIETLVKRVYDIRSKFVHHGQRPTDMETLGRFMEKVWVLFFHFILNVSTIETKDEMIDTLKRIKYA